MNNKLNNFYKVENIKLRDEIDCIFDDFNIGESRDDLWLKINRLIDNEVRWELEITK